MIDYRLLLTKSAEKDKEKVKSIPALRRNVDELLKLIARNPFIYPPSYEILQGDLKGVYSRRINKQHRLVYTVDEEHREIVILRMWTHYE